MTAFMAQCAEQAPTPIGRSLREAPFMVFGVQANVRLDYLPGTIVCLSELERRRAERFGLVAESLPAVRDHFDCVSAVAGNCRGICETDVTDPQR
jgi:hypothetical protein